MNVKVNVKGCPCHRVTSLIYMVEDKVNQQTLASHAMVHVTLMLGLFSYCNDLPAP